MEPQQILDQVVAAMCTLDKFKPPGKTFDKDAFLSALLQEIDIFVEKAIEQNDFLG